MLLFCVVPSRLNHVVQVGSSFCDPSSQSQNRPTSCALPLVTKRKDWKGITEIYDGTECSRNVATYVTVRPAVKEDTNANCH